jgi:hypothetical protein
VLLAGVGSHAISTISRQRAATAEQAATSGPLSAQERASHEPEGRACRQVGHEAKRTLGESNSYSQEECCMTRKIAGTCFAALLGFALSAAAQSTPSSPQTPQTSPQPTSPYPSSQASQPDKSDKAGKSTKLTGCIQSGTTAGTYELTNIKKGMGRDSASSSSSSAPSATESASSSKSVKLVAAAGVDLSQHVGHQVEVAGNWASSSSSSSSTASSSTSSSTPPSSTESSASMSGGKEFNVTDVKMVSATCSAGTN